MPLTWRNINAPAPTTSSNGTLGADLFNAGLNRLTGAVNQIQDERQKVQSAEFNLTKKDNTNAALAELASINNIDEFERRKAAGELPTLAQFDERFGRAYDREAVQAKLSGKQDALQQRFLEQTSFDDKRHNLATRDAVARYGNDITTLDGSPAQIEEAAAIAEGNIRNDKSLNERQKNDLLGQLQQRTRAARSEFFADANQERTFNRQQISDDLGKIVAAVSSNGADQATQFAQVDRWVTDNQVPPEIAAQGYAQLQGNQSRKIDMAPADQKQYDGMLQTETQQLATALEDEKRNLDKVYAANPATSTRRWFQEGAKSATEASAKNILYNKLGENGSFFGRDAYVGKDEFEDAWGTATKEALSRLRTELPRNEGESDADYKARQQAITLPPQVLEEAARDMQPTDTDLVGTTNTISTDKLASTFIDYIREYNEGLKANKNRTDAENAYHDKVRELKQNAFAGSTKFANERRLINYR